MGASSRVEFWIFEIRRLGGAGSRGNVKGDKVAQNHCGLLVAVN